MKHEVDVLIPVHPGLNLSSESGVESEKCLPTLSGDPGQPVA